MSSPWELKPRVISFLFDRTKGWKQQVSAFQSVIIVSILAKKRMHSYTITGGRAPSV
jgi:hypothetical protein